MSNRHTQESGGERASVTTPVNTFGGYRIEVDQRCLIDTGGNRVALRAQSLAVLEELARNPDKVVTKDQLLRTVWPDVQVTDDSLTKCVSDIRKAIGDTKHEILRTVPRQGYLLVPDDEEVEHAETDRIESGQKRVRWALLGVVFLVVGFALFVNGVQSAKPRNSSVATTITGTPTVAVVFEAGDSGKARESTDLMSQLNVALSRYRTLQIVDSPDTEYELLISDSAQGDQLTATLSKRADRSLVFARTYERTADADEDERIAMRLAAAIASPGVGALDRELMESSRLKPVEDLTQAECFAHGFGCAKCSGEEDNITRRAEACLAHILDTDDSSARAWALQATIYAHQYWWGNTLSEPLRSNVSLRDHLPAKAIEAANRAESLSTGDDSAIYWGMAEAYYSSCQTDKLHTAIQRGLELSPDDPNLLASFGNWLSYSGQWEEGAALTQRALNLEPQHYRKWWWMGIAKPRYFKEDFQGAYEAFLKAFNDRNWVSQLQFAYTLPHLDRLDEARDAVANVQDLFPGVTLEKALEQYEILCFPDSYLQNMKRALTAAGMPSRGDSSDFADITLPTARTVELDNFVAEYLDEGAGTTVVFVHGSVSDYHSWGQYLVPISEKFRFISYSRRYYGTQAWTDNGERFTIAQHTQDLIDFIEALDIGPVHVVTWSSSFSPVHLASVKRPDLFDSLIHFEPVDLALFSGQSVDEAELDDWESRWAGYDEAEERGDEELMIARFMEIVFEMKPGGFHHERESQQEVNRRNARTLAIEFLEADESRFPVDCDMAARTTVPTLIVNGELTHYFFRRQAEIAAACIPDAELVTIPGVNHRGPLDAAPAFADIIAGFVAMHE